MNIYLDKLELHGFKSFPEKTVIKFHKGITAVIGPNGCGKSNIVDAVLWVLGEQKIKSLRGENNEDLIFNGSADKKPLGMTEVGAHFIKDYEPVYLARRYYRNAETKYILNEKYCRNKDIQKALYDMEMGEKKYFIFEQGSIDKLVSLKAGEKRILIEEAAGVLQYLERKKETVNKLIIAEQNLENLDMLIFDKEKRLKELKNQVNYVQRYRNAKMEKINHLKALIQKKYNTIQKEVKENIILKDKNINEETLQIRQSNEIEKSLIEMEETKWKIDQEQKKLEKSKFESNSQIISTQKEIEKKKQQRDFSQQRIHDINKETEQNERELKGIAPEIEREETELESLKKQLKQATGGQDEIKEKIASMKSELDSDQTKNKTLRTALFKIQSEISQERNRLNKLERTKFLNENEIKNKHANLAELKNRQLDERISSNEAEIRKLENEFSNVNHNLQNALKRQKGQLDEINEVKREINEIENEISSLTKQREKYLELKKKISGIDDSLEPGNIFSSPLQDILETDPKHFKSIENFFYEEMDSVFLNKGNEIPEDISHKFILVRNQRHPMSEANRAAIRNEAGFIDFIGNIYRLSDPNFQNSLRDGILASDLKTAASLYIQYGYPVVTPEGEVISEGGVVIRNRDKGILNINQEISEAEQKIEKGKKVLVRLKDRLEQKNVSFKQVSAAIEKDQAVAKAMEKELIQKRSSLEMIKNDAQKNRKRIEILEKELTIIEKDNRELLDKFEAMKATENSLKADESELIKKGDAFRKQVDKAKDRIIEVEKKYLQQQSSTKLIQERINSIKAKISSQQNIEKRLIEQNRQNRDKLRELAAQNQLIDQNMTELKGDLRTFEKRLKQNEADLATVGKRSSKVGSEIKQHSEKYNKLRDSISELRSAKGEIEIALSGFKKDVFQLEDIALKELNDEIKNIKGTEEYLEKDTYELEEAVQQYDEKLNRMRDSEKLNFSAESEYELLYKNHGFLLTQKEDVIKSIQDMHDVIEKIDSESKISFLKAYNEIKRNFVENFKILFEGGDATLKLTDESNLLETGLDIKAQPPGKQLLSLRLLSGGEKTLTSLAFLFALFQYKPAPFCIFDEVDASLDEANIQRFLKFLHILKKHTQFLIITHNFKTMEEADYLYGISMNKPGISTVYSTKFSEKKIN